jgi:hypothetical protein
MHVAIVNEEASNFSLAVSGIKKQAGIFPACFRLALLPSA